MYVTGNASAPVFGPVLAIILVFTYFTIKYNKVDGKAHTRALVIEWPRGLED